MRLKFVVSLATFTALANAGLTIYDPNYVANGTFCVDQNARDLFAALNDLRMKGKASSYYTAFKAACDSVSANGYWTTSYGDRVNLSNRAYAASALSTFDAKTAVSTGLSWSPGLAAAGQFLFNSWTQSGARGLIDANGGTPTARAQTYGELGNSSHVEYVTYAAVEFWSIQDAVNAMLIADGDPNAVVMTNLFDYRNTVAVAFKGNADIGTDGNTFMMEFQAAKSYVEKSTTNTACTITQNFGGFLCDQVGKAKDLFNAINSVRTDPNPETNAWFGSQIKKWQSGFQTSNTGGTSQIPMTLTDPDTGTNSIVNTSEGKPCVDGAITELTNLYNTKTILKPLAWSSPLQMAGQDWVDQIKAQSSVVTTVNGQTTASRAGKYGQIATGGRNVYQSIIGQYAFNGLDAAVFWTVDDGSQAQNYPNRAAILSPSFTQIAVNYSPSQVLANTNIYTANFADEYYTPKEGISCTNTGVTIASVEVIDFGAPLYIIGTPSSAVNTVASLSILATLMALWF